MEAHERAGEPFKITPQASGQQDEAPGGFLSFHHDQFHSTLSGLTSGVLSGVALVGNGHFHPGSGRFLSFKAQVFDLCPILFVDW